MRSAVCRDPLICLPDNCSTFAIPILKNCFVNSNSISSSEENNKNKRKPYAYGDRMAAAAVATMRDILIELQGGPADCTLHFVDIKKAATVTLCYDKTQLLI